MNLPGYSYHFHITLVGNQCADKEKLLQSFEKKLPSVNNLNGAKWFFDDLPDAPIHREIENFHTTQVYNKGDITKEFQQTLRRTHCLLVLVEQGDDDNKEEQFCKDLFKRALKNKHLPLLLIKKDTSCNVQEIVAYAKKCEEDLYGAKKESRIAVFEKSDVPEIIKHIGEKGHLQKRLDFARLGEGIKSILPHSWKDWYDKHWKDTVVPMLVLTLVLIILVSLKGCLEPPPPPPLPPKPLAAPPNLQAKVLESKNVNLTWNSVSGAASYQIYRVSTDGTEILLGTTEGAKYTTACLPVGKNTLRVYALKSNLKSKPGEVIAEVSLPPPNPLYPELKDKQLYALVQRGKTHQACTNYLKECPNGKMKKTVTAYNAYLVKKSTIEKQNKRGKVPAVPAGAVEWKVNDTNEVCLPGSQLPVRTKIKAVGRKKTWKPIWYKGEWPRWYVEEIIVQEHTIESIGVPLPPEPRLPAWGSE